MTRLALRLLVVSQVALGSACAGLGVGDALDPLPAPDAGAPTRGNGLRVELGTGIGAFEPVADGDMIEVIMGPQGGFHIWTSVRVYDLALEAARIDLSARFSDDDARPVGNASSIATALTVTGDARERSGMPNFVPLDVRGRRLILHVDVLAADGRRGQDERVVVPR